MPLTSEHTIDPARTVARAQFVLSDFKGGVFTARVIGPHLGEREAQIVSREINLGLHEAGSSLKCVVLDLSGVRAMSSIGLGMCIDTRNNADARRAKTIVVGLCRELYELFRMMKVDRLFTLAHDNEELQKILKKHGYN